MENSENKKTITKTQKILISIISSLILVIIGAFYLNSLKYESTDDAYVESDLIQIASRISGQIEEIYIQDNQKIYEGDLIAK